MRHAFLLAGLMLATVAYTFGDLDSIFVADPNHPAIEYNTRPLKDPVSELNRKIQAGQVRLNFDEPQGYLRSVLEALSVPIESQIVVFSKTSVQMFRINPHNPRTHFRLSNRYPFPISQRKVTLSVPVLPPTWRAD